MVYDGQALGAGVAALLDARRKRDLSALVSRSQVLFSPSVERWTMGAREVSAFHVALVVSAEDHAALSSSAEKLEQVREAFAAALRTPETEMAELSLVLALPPVGLPFSHVYRGAPPRDDEAPEPRAVLAGAAKLCSARGDQLGAAMLERASIEQAVAVGSARSMRRFLVRLEAADLAAAERDAALADRLMGAVRDAAATATEPVSAVVLGVLLS